jgi:electron transfer flavoprotein beta subunit
MSLETTDGNKALLVGREVDTGVLTLKVTLPAVVTVDLRIVQSKAVKNSLTPASHAYSDDIRHIAVKGIMAAKKKPLDSKGLADFGVSASSSVTYTKFELPAARSGNTRYIESVSELVKLLQTDAKAL